MLRNSRLCAVYLHKENIITASVKGGPIVIMCKPVTSSSVFDMDFIQRKSDEKYEK